MSDVKSFFHQWCVKKSLEPKYDLRPTGPQHRLMFICELRVPGHEFVGSGNGNSKKEATFEAAREFVNYLVRVGEIKEAFVPSEAVEERASSATEAPVAVRSVFKPGFDPSTFGQAYTPLAGPPADASAPTGDTPRSVYDVIAQQTSGEAEEVDLNASIHGNWTIENAKSKLHQFFQMHQIAADYKYSVTGPDHSKNFFAEMTIPIPNTDRKISAREAASTKQMASKCCALSLVRQLYHLNAIEAFSGSLKKKPIDEFPPYQVVMNPLLIPRIEKVLADHDVKLPRKCELTALKSPTLLLSNNVKEEIIAQTQQEAGIIDWAPPSNEWHTWLGMSIDEGSTGKVDLDELSKEMRTEWQDLNAHDNRYRRILEERKKLPVYNSNLAILSAIHENPVIIIRGCTGSGKTTQVCQFILDEYIHAGTGAYCNVCVTQPRRISTISLADRIASERCEELGQSVGYSVRFEAVYPRPFGSIFFCTIGVLLKRLESGLRGVTHVIVDEIHERDVNTDFLLVIIRDMVHTYPGLKVILMSATIDVSMFSAYFNHCPVIEVKGSSFEVKSYFLEDIVELLRFTAPTHYEKKTKTNKDKEEDSECADDDDNLNLHISDDYSPNARTDKSHLNEKQINTKLIEALIQYCRNEMRGAILIFLTGWSQIHQLMKALTSNSVFNRFEYLILPLHSQIPREDQRKVFDPAPPGVTKVILSTNIAESSITINDVVCVVDLCLVKTEIFTSHNNTINYATVWCSKSSIEQRKGRAGRVQPGFAFHLISKARYDKLEAYATPEMLRTPLHQLALSIKALRLGNIAQFLSKAIEPPPLDAVIEAEILLRQLKCLDKSNDLTPLGKILARLPTEPSVGRMLILGCLLKVGDGLLTICGSVSTFPEIFIPFNGRLADFQRRLGGPRPSDHLASMKVFNIWSSIVSESPHAGSDFCEKNKITESILKVVADARSQLKDLLKYCGFPASTLSPISYEFSGVDENLDTITALLCVGFYPNICYHKEKRKVLTCESKTALVHATSINCSNHEVDFLYPFIVFGEKVRTELIACKQTTVVSPLHLLLFGCNKVEVVNGVIRLDNWINLKLDPYAAALVVKLRPLVEDLLELVSEQPTLLASLSPKQQGLVSVVRQICLMNMSLNLNEIPNQTPFIDKSEKCDRLPKNFRPSKRGLHVSNSNHKDRPKPQTVSNPSPMIFIPDAAYRFSPSTQSVPLNPPPPLPVASPTGHIPHQERFPRPSFQNQTYQYGSSPDRGRRRGHVRGIFRHNFSRPVWRGDT